MDKEQRERIGDVAWALCSSVGTCDVCQIQDYCKELLFDDDHKGEPCQRIFWYWITEGEPLEVCAIKNEGQTLKTLGYK